MKTARRTFIALMLATLAVGQGVAMAEDGLLARVTASGVLRVANTQGNPPWDMLDANNVPAGLGIEMTQEIAKRMGIAKVEFVAARFSDLIPGVQADKYDLVVAGHTITDERKKVVDFSLPYMVVGNVIFVKPGNEALSSLEAFRGKSFGVLAGSVHEDMMKTTFPNGDVTVKTYETPTQMLQDIALGRVDGGLYSSDAAAYLIQKNSIDVVAGAQIDQEVNGMVFGKDSPDFKAALDAAFQSMIDDGTYAAMSRRWLGTVDMAAELQKLP